MHVPIRWLREFVEIPDPITVEELAHRLTMAGIEVASIKHVGLSLPEEAGRGLHARWTSANDVTAGIVWDPERLIVGEVVSVEAHPNADRLYIAQVETGQGVFQVVHGAPNLPPGSGSEGQKVAVALPGTRIVNAYGDEPYMSVKRLKLRGVESQAVICSEKELGLSDDHSGVLILDDEAPVGASLSECMGDQVLDLDLTPNLGRCLSVVGVAREVAALTDAPLTLAEPAWTAEGPAAEDQVRVEIEAPQLCLRYTAALIRDVQRTQTPFWMRYRLLLSGIRPIHPLVDVTNYVMLEWGQPLHAFDYDRLLERAGGERPTIIVRRAKPGETIITLDDVERALRDDMLVIADLAGPIAIAGVMGGRDTEVSPETRHVLLESACFHAINNRRTAGTLQLSSEASHRFSRGVPPELAAKASVRASELMRELAGGTIARGLVDAYPHKPEPKTIRLAPADVNRLLGMELNRDEIIATLEKLEFACRSQDDQLDVEVPYYRLDVEIPADLIEEVARVIGYDRLPSALLPHELPSQRRNRSLEWEERVRDILVGCGLTEVINYALTGSHSVARLYPAGTPPHEPHIELENPISVERTQMRKTLANGLLENVASNQRHHERVALFEIGRVYLPTDDELPEEPRRLGLTLAGRRRKLSWAEPQAPVDFFDIKGIIETLLDRLHVENAIFAPTSAPMLHPGRAAEVRVDAQPVGVLGEVHPQVSENFELKGRVYLAELDLERLIEQADEVRAYRPIPRFPGVRQDLAVVVDEGVPAKQVEQVIRRSSSELLKDVTLFDVYRGQQVPEGQKSLAYSLFYQAEDRTLTDEEAQTIHERIQQALERELDARVRGLDG